MRFRAGHCGIGGLFCKAGFGFVTFPFDYFLYILFKRIDPHVNVCHFTVRRSNFRPLSRTRQATNQEKQYGGEDLVLLPFDGLTSRLVSKNDYNMRRALYLLPRKAQQECHAPPLIPLNISDTMEYLVSPSQYADCRTSDNVRHRPLPIPEGPLQKPSQSLITQPTFHFSASPPSTHGIQEVRNRLVDKIGVRKKPLGKMPMAHAW
jgi:hypothetical protein